MTIIHLIMSNPPFRRVALAIILAMICSAPSLFRLAHADSGATAGEKLALQMRQYQMVKGRFEQWRKLAGIPRPIHSTGHFIYWRGHGLYWETQHPIFQAFTFTPDSVIHWQSNATAQKPDKSSAPFQKQINRILLAVFGGEIQLLEKLFDSHWSSGPKQWSVRLRPTRAAVKQVVQEITLTGRDYVNGLSLINSNGDITRISFFSIRGFNYPAVDDCQYFNPDSQPCPGDKADAPREP